MYRLCGARSGSPQLVEGAATSCMHEANLDTLGSSSRVTAAIDKCTRDPRGRATNRLKHGALKLQHKDDGHRIMATKLPTERHQSPFASRRNRCFQEESLCVDSKVQENGFGS